MMIGDQIRVTVTRIDSDAVKLGFTAPSKTLIYRDEIYREIKQANREALRRPSDAAGMPALRIDRVGVGKSLETADSAMRVSSAKGDVVVPTEEIRRGEDARENSPT